MIGYFLLFFLLFPACARDGKKERDGVERKKRSHKEDGLLYYVCDSMRSTTDRQEKNETSGSLLFTSLPSPIENYIYYYKDERFYVGPMI